MPANANAANGMVEVERHRAFRREPFHVASFDRVHEKKKKTLHLAVEGRYAGERRYSVVVSCFHRANKYSNKWWGGVITADAIAIQPKQSASVPF